MKLVFAVGLALVSGIAQAGKPVDIPVEVYPVQIEQPQPARWVEHRNIPHDKAVDLIAAGANAGGVCHELTAEQIVVCLFPGNRSGGIDWDKLSKGLAQGK